MEENRTARVVDKWNKNRYLKIFGLLVGLIASILGIAGYVFGPDIEFECKLREAATNLDQSLAANQSKEIFGEVDFDEDKSEFRAILEFNERVNFGSGTQIFRDSNRIFAINNIAQELVQVLESLDHRRNSYEANVNFRGGADASGGQGYFAKSLDIGDLVLAARSPTINNIPLDATPEFRTGVRIDNEDLALVRASYVAHIFISKVDDANMKILFDDAYFATTYEEIGPLYRYGKIEVKIASKSNGMPKIIPYKIVCNNLT